MTESVKVNTVAVPRTPDRRLLLVFLLLGAGLILLLFNLAGSQNTVALIQNAQPTFVLLVLAAQAMRYVGSTSSTVVLANMFGRRMPFLPLYEAMMAGQALNRTFSVGGAAGMYVRYSFLTRQELHSGAVTALFAIEEILGIVTLALVFATGIAAVVARDIVPESAWVAAAGLGAVAVLAGLGMLVLYRRRDVVERLVHAITRVLGAIVARLIGKEVYRKASVDLAIDEFYGGMKQARRDPPAVAASFLLNLLRLAFDAASLFFAFYAVGFAIAPGFLLVIFAGSNALSAMSGVPGELGVMETSLTLISTSLGIAPSTAVSAVVLFRALSYWLPIPLGYLAFWHLQRRGFI